MKWTVCEHSARYRLGFGGGEEPCREAVTPETRLHPEVLQFAAVAPGPSADAGDDCVAVAYEDRQVEFVTESHGGGRLTTDLRFEEFDLEWIRLVLDVELHRDRLASVADDLLEQRDVVEVRTERPDFSVVEVGHGDAGQLDVPSRCFQHGVLAED